MSDTQPTRKYAPFDLTFTDKGRQGSRAVPSLCQTHENGNQAPAGRGRENPTQAARNLLLATIHPDDKERLTEALEEYPGIATTFSTALIRAVGIAADLGN